jgi:hypothetical protein
MVHPKCLSAAIYGRRGITAHGNFSSAEGRRNSRSHGTMPNQALSFGYWCVICLGSREIAQKPAFQVSFHTIALQKSGVGQPVRRKEDIARLDRATR